MRTIFFVAMGWLVGLAAAHATAPLEIDMRSAAFSSADGDSYVVTLAGSVAYIEVNEAAIGRGKFQVRLRAPGALKMESSGIAEDRVAAAPRQGERILLLQFSVARSSEDASGNFPTDRYEVRLVGRSRTCEMSVFDESGNSMGESTCDAPAE